MESIILRDLFLCPKQTRKNSVHMLKLKSTHLPFNSRCVENNGLF